MPERDLHGDVLLNAISERVGFHLCQLGASIGLMVQYEPAGVALVYTIMHLRPVAHIVRTTAVMALLSWLMSIQP